MRGTETIVSRISVAHPADDGLAHASGLILFVRHLLSSVAREHLSRPAAQPGGGADDWFRTVPSGS